MQYNPLQGNQVLYKILFVTFQLDYECYICYIGYPLRNICVAKTTDNISFIHSLRNTMFLRRIRHRYHQWGRNCLPFSSQWVRVVQSLVFCVVFCRSFLCFLFWSLYCRDRIFIVNCTKYIPQLARLHTGFQAGPYFPNFPYFWTAALIFLIKASQSQKSSNFWVKILKILDNYNIK